MHAFVSLARRFKGERCKWGTGDYVHSSCTHPRNDHLYETVYSAILSAALGGMLRA